MDASRKEHPQLLITPPYLLQLQGHDPVADAALPATPSVHPSRVDNQPLEASGSAAAAARHADVEALFEQEVLPALRSCMQQYGDARPEAVPVGRVATHCLVRTAMQVCGNEGDGLCVDVAMRTLERNAPAVPDAVQSDAVPPGDYDALLGEIHQRALGRDDFLQALESLAAAVYPAAPASMRYTRDALHRQIRISGRLPTFRVSALQVGLRLRAVLDQIAADIEQLQPERADGAGSDGFAAWLDQRYPGDAVVALTHAQLSCILDDLAAYLNDRA